MSDEFEQRAAGRVRRALAHLDAGRVDRARDELAALLGTLEGASTPRARTEPLDDGVGFDEIERAVDAAEADVERMLDANDIAERALADAIAIDESRPSDSPAPSFATSAFVTETMAGLLERQGDADGARAIRASLGETSSSREQTVATLEGWLRNLRGGSA